jgi:hypothetical protein
MMLMAKRPRAGGSQAGMRAFLSGELTRVEDENGDEIVHHQARRASFPITFRCEEPDGESIALPQVYLDNELVTRLTAVLRYNEQNTPS